jgi:hypothetical protein
MNKRKTTYRSYETAELRNFGQVFHRAEIGTKLQLDWIDEAEPET